MIAFLRGRIREKNTGGIVLDVNGVGYELYLSANSLSKMPAIGEEASLFTYLHVRDDALQLFGFATSAEKELFGHLLSVSGVGPRVALSILSAFSVTTLKKAIAMEDVDLISAIPGIGKKSAQRLILELKGKLALPDLKVPAASGASSSAFVEARNALVGLGYSVAEANSALEGFPYGNEEPTAEDLLRYALKNLAGPAGGEVSR